MTTFDKLKKAIGIRLVEDCIQCGAPGPHKMVALTTGNNMNSSFGIRIIASDGSTVRKTVLAVTREAAEFDAGTPGTLESRNNTATSVAGNYTTVAGDYLVIEIGAAGDPSSANPHTYNISLGNNAAVFLDASDIDTGADNPWVQLADTLVLEYTITPPSVSASTIFEPTISQPAQVIETGSPVSQSTITPPELAHVLEPPAVSLSTITPPELAYVMEPPALSLSQIFPPDNIEAVPDALTPLAVALSQIFVPELAYQVEGVFTSLSQIYAPVLAYRVQPPFTRISQIFSPTLVGGEQGGSVVALLYRKLSNRIGLGL